MRQKIEAIKIAIMGLLIGFLFAQCVTACASGGGCRTYLQNPETVAGQKCPLNKVLVEITSSQSVSCAEVAVSCQ